MPFRSTSNNAKQCNAIAPVNPETKCRKRQRTALHTLVQGGRDDEFVTEAEEFDIHCVVFDADLEAYNQLPKRCCPLSPEPSDELLSSEVATLAASVKSMEKNVAKATEKINELRGLVALYLEQQRQAPLSTN